MAWTDEARAAAAAAKKGGVQQQHEALEMQGLHGEATRASIRERIPLQTKPMLSGGRGPSDATSHTNGPAGHETIQAASHSKEMTASLVPGSQERADKLKTFASRRAIREEQNRKAAIDFGKHFRGES